MSTPNSKTLLLLTEEMGQFRAEMETIDKVASRIASKTTRIIKVVMMMLAVASLVLIFLVYSMSNYLGVMLNHLDNMYAEFGIMSENMQMITGSVDNIGSNITGMPVIADNMQGMSTDLKGVVGSVQAIKHEMSGMENNTGKMGVNTKEMAHRFDNLNRAVNHIGYNVNQMGKPIP